MLRIALGVSIVCALASCGDDGGDDTPIGVVDAASTAACAAFPNGTALTAAETADGAASAELHPEAARLVTLSEEGYITLHADVSHHDWAIFVSEGTTLANAELGFPGATRAGACPDAGLWDYRVHVHEGGEYVLELHNHGGAPVFAYAYRMESDHSGDGGVDDGGHDHGDGGHDHGDGGHDHGDGGHDHGDGGHDHGDGGHDHDHGDGGHDHDHDHGDAG